MNNPFDYTPDAACDEAFHDLTIRLEALRNSELPTDINFCHELEAGKMLGVLIAEDTEGQRHTLYAFSGQLGDAGFHFPGFVGPVFDYLQPDGYFKTKEAFISLQNLKIGQFEKDDLTEIRIEYEQAKLQSDKEIAEYKDKCRLSKLERDSTRANGSPDAPVLAAMIRQSQFEKAELHRLKKKLTADLEPFAIRLQEAESHLAAMKEKRRSDSEALQKWLFDNFLLLNARGETKSLDDIFADTAMKIPPSGAGECCAPKLLHAAYIQNWKPIAMAEYWYGRPKGGEVRIHGCHYPACRGKCLPILSWMLQGLSIEPPLDSVRQSITEKEPEIIYENQWFCVVNKPSGMLSVPGKGSAISVQQWLQEKYGPDKFMKMVHRLDQDTSGLVIAALEQSSFKMLQSLFARRKVKKTYIAELEGNYEALGIPRHARIELPISPDWLDRPRQKIDYEGGKEAITEYEFIGHDDDRSRIIFHPLTGRTHQLRVHAASGNGLGMPIAGDRIYGKKSEISAKRLLLHAHKIEFTFPIDRQNYSFESSIPF